MIHVNVRTRRTRALCFDLEARPLAFWYDSETTKEITAFGWKWSDEKDVNTLLLLPDGEYVVGESQLTLEYDFAHEVFRDELAKADLVYGHNIRRYDLPLINAWLLRLQLEPLPELRTTDTLKDIPKRGAMSASLESLASLYGLPGKKYTMSTPMWEAANQLTPEGIALARKRVSSDVLLQEKLRDKLLELGVLKEPRVWRP